ncbi:hypothetical protein DTL42_02550 [Bremerella cremea]|uniref:Tetratricopeptide repeat protein n=1 Tax=Bremerella cremea TaxID=1031537 RepID=A0A368KUE6_9BACT|nr:hypothetical protein DTL42_02550 [Bremerella cremea]
MVYGVIIVVTVFVVLAVARYYPTSSSNLPADTSVVTAAQIELPEEAVSISVEDMRQEIQDFNNQFIANYPNAAAPHKIAAEFAQQTYRYEEAQSHWQTALQLDPQSIDAQTGLASVAIEEGRPQDAVDRLEKLLPSHPANLQLSIELARGLQQTGKLDQAAQVSLEALKWFPYDGRLLQTAAEIELQRGELSSAKALCERGIEQHPANGSLHFILSNVDRRLGNVELADQHLKISKDLRPEGKPGASEFEANYERSLRKLVALTLAQAAEFTLDQGDAKQATKIALRAAEINPTSGIVYSTLSKVLYRQERFADAYQAQRRLIEIEPDNPLNFINLSKLAFLAGDAPGGKKALLIAYQRMPNSPIVVTALAAFFLEEGNFEKARQLAEKSIELKPTVQAYEILSVVYANLGDPRRQAEADRQIEQLMKSSPLGDEPALK